MRKLLIFVLLHIVSLFAYAQYTPILPVKLPELLPPTPDVAALIKVGMGSVNFSTGAVTASIPIYKMQLGAFSLPISLDYSSQGTKVLEPCTRVGANWMLNAAGVVSRSVVGRPDELATRPAMPSDLSAINIDNYNYFKQSANLDPTSTFDTQPDEFRFNINGESGKFVLDQNRNAVINAHSNLKINVSVLGDEISEIIITTTDGTKYYFGADGAYETTISVVNMMFRQSIKTAFYLTKIELLSGDKIDFYYSSLNTKVSLGNVTTMVVGADGEGSQCTPIGSELSYTTKSQEVEYRTCRLNSIVASNGQRAIFGYENRNDASNEVVLKNISVATTVSTIKFYKLFHYTESVFGSGQNGRFYLTKLRQLDTQPGFNENDENNPRQEYNFEYEDMEHHVTDGQDHWGFANGSGSGVSFQHPTYGSSSIVVVGGAPNSQYSKKGVLKKIIYPTGGIEEFKCEGNTLSVEEKVNTTYSLYIEGRGQAGNTFSNPGKLYYGTVEPLRNQVIKVLISAIFDPASPGPSHPGDNTKTMFVTATDITTGDIKMNDYILGTQTLDLTLSVTAGHEYVFKMEVRGGDYMLGRTVITYDTSSRDYYKWVEKEAGGVRVSKILRTDPVTGKVVKKCYTYRSLDDTLRSSGEGSLTVSYHSRTCNAYYVQSGLGETRYLCYSDVYSSNSVFNIFRYDNSHMAYKAIIESDDEQMSNGGTEYVFYTPVFTGGGGWAVWGPVIPNMPLNTSPNYNGLVRVKRIFDKDKRVLSAESKDYEIVSSGADMITGVACRINFEPRPPKNPISTFDFDHFSVTAYVYSSMWRRLRSVTTTTIDKNNFAFTQTKEYSYGTPGNVNEKSVRTINSKGLEILQSKKYATDFSGQPIHDLMTSKNLIAPVIEEAVTNNQVEIARKKVLYKDWFANGKVIQPEIIQLKESPSATLANNIQFVSYDESANVTEVEKVNDLRTVYLWDYKKSAVIAEIKGTSLDKVAYTSFETEATGNWTLSNASYHDEGVTGRRSFSGTLTKTFSQPINAVITLWSKSTTPTVNGSTTTVLVNRGLWKLFRWQLTNASSVTIAGVNLDEVRLMPENAFMVTYTYGPFVGVESKCDLNNIITNYEYDGFGRLAQIRDQDSNIIKRICYNYAGQPEDCLTGIYKNKFTSANFTRNCPSGQTGSSVTYMIPSGKYQSIISQADADQQATNDLLANGQRYADSLGTCTTVQTQAFITVTNAFEGSSIPKSTVEFLQNGTVISSVSFPLTNGGNNSINLTPGVYQLRFKVTASYANSLVGYSLSGMLSWLKQAGQTSVTTGNVTLNAENYTIFASDAVAFSRQ